MEKGFHIAHVSCNRAENGYSVNIEMEKPAAKYSHNNYKSEQVLFEFDKHESAEATKEAALNKVKECFREKLNYEDKMKSKNSGNKSTKAISKY